jgi:hypothetical protein
MQKEQNTTQTQHGETTGKNFFQNTVNITQKAQRHEDILGCGGIAPRIL